MKDIINDLYDINVLSFIKVSDKTYRIKSDENDYVLKYIDKANLDTIIEKIKVLKIDTILLPISNKYGEYVSKSNDYTFTIFPYLNEEKTSLNDLKLKFYLSELASLHNKTYYHLKVNSSFFKDTYEYIGSIIDKEEEKINNYMNVIEKKDYKSPSEWLFLLNYPLYVKAIDEANSSLEKFKKISYSKSNVRMAYCFNNFDYKHIFLKERMIIGVDNIVLSSPVYDIFYILSTIENNDIDIKNYYVKYFHSFILDDYEKEWLYSLLYIPKLETSEFEHLNIINISQSLNKLKSSYDIIETLKNINFN
ncbi:MAG: hypothetical protein IKJ30_01895 [Bacilli bacterium]|nr:hypothetical protein [Bacilli bacterium]